MSGYGIKAQNGAASIRSTSIYRSDIDGLRAVAVALVIAFHAGLATFRNGYLGVDVFFVISGYLISAIIFDGLEREAFSFRDFYVRRINRILPALITVVLATAAAGWLVMYDSEFAALGQHVIASTTFVSNFLLWRQTGYFDLPQKPLLHLWSLAVEEQFYLLWPVAAVIVWGRSRRQLTWILAGMIAASFTVGLLQIATNPSAGFYLPFGRFWEILAGALLQHVVRNERAIIREPVRNLRWRAEVRALCGSALIIIAMAIAIPEGTWPGWRASLPVAGTMLLLSSRDSILNRRVLSFGPLVTVGLISYPLYLWHWPLLVFVRLIFEGDVTPGLAALAVAMSFLLSAITFRYIEIPIRFGKRKRRSAFFLLCSLPLIALLGLTMGVIGTRSSGGPVQRKKWGPDWTAPGTATVNQGKGILIFSLPGDSSRTVFMYGDSHINHYWPRVLELASSLPGPFPTVSIVGYGGCPPLPDVNRRGIDWASKPWECDRIYRAALDHARSPQVKTVLISAWWELYTARMVLYRAADTSSVPLSQGDPRLEQVFSDFERDLGGLVAAGKRVYLVLPSPTPGSQFPKSRFPRRLMNFGRQDKMPSILRGVFDEQTRWVSARLRKVAERSGGILIDPAEFLCVGKLCPTAMSSGMPIYRDNDHLRAGFVAKYAAFLDEVFK